MEKSRSQPEHKRMSKNELAQRLHALQVSSQDEAITEAREIELQTVLQELETYQIELEMQNRELRESRESLEESHDRFVNLYDFAPIGYVTFNDQGLMKELNLKMASMLGVDRRWLIDRSLSPWIAGADLPVFRKHIQTCRSIDEKEISVFRLVRKDKQTIVVELTSACSNDKISGERVIRTAVVDITQKKKLEDELHKSLAGLKDERKLRELFVSTLTHDLRTPLATIKMGTQLILRNPQTIDENRTLAVRVLDGVERMDLMIHDLLDANRISAGEKLPLSFSEFDLVFLVQQTLDALSVAHGNRFKLKSPDSMLCNLDPKAIRRIVENLCNNAVKYGDSEKPVSVTIKPIGSKILLSVHNHGPVISRLNQLTLFDQFQRSDSAKSSGKKGWGVGLTLVRGLTESHGGQVSLVSEPGRGTTFIVELPSRD